MIVNPAVRYLGLFNRCAGLQLPGFSMHLRPERGHMRKVFNVHCGVADHPPQNVHCRSDLLKHLRSHRECRQALGLFCAYK